MNLQYYFARFNVLPFGSPLAKGTRRRDNKVPPKPKATGEDLFVLQPADPFEDNAAPVGR